MSVNIPNTFTAGAIVDPGSLNANFSALANKFSSGIVAFDLSPSAGILNSQLANKYEHLEIKLQYGTGTAIPAAWPGANARVDYHTIVGITGTTPWTVTDIYWMCTDTGDGLGSFNVLWGEFTAGGIWSTVTTLLGAPQVMSNAAALQDGNDGISVLAAPVNLAVGAGPRHLALVSVAAGAGLLSAATDQLSVTCRLRREIAAS